MRYERPLLRAILLKRYKRFLADVRLADGREITVHCANSGSMLGCAEPGSDVYISDSENPARKLRHTLELVLIGNTWIGVNTALPNAALASFIQRNLIPELADYGSLRREVKYGRDGRSRIDLLLGSPGRPDCYVEVKNTTLRLGEYAAFPDAVTERGRKHLEDLSEVARRGERAVMFYFVGRDDCDRFRPADEIDPAYGLALRQALAAGVEAIAWRCRYDECGVAPVKRIDMHF